MTNILQLANFRGQSWRHLSMEPDLPSQNPSWGLAPGATNSSPELN